MSNEKATDVCLFCRGKYDPYKQAKYRPFCSKKCFYDHIGRYMKGKDEAIPVCGEGHDMYCRLCGKKVDALYNGSFCSIDCESDFSHLYDEYIMEVKQKRRNKHTFIIHCNLCGKSFGAKSKRNRFCDVCSNERNEVKNKCFRISGNFGELRKKGTSMCEMVIKCRESGKSYAELQKEETLNRMRNS